MRRRSRKQAPYGGFCAPGVPPWGGGPWAAPWGAPAAYGPWPGPWSWDPQDDPSPAGLEDPQEDPSPAEIEDPQDDPSPADIEDPQDDPSPAEIEDPSIPPWTRPPVDPYGQAASAGWPGSGFPGGWGGGGCCCAASDDTSAAGTTLRGCSRSGFVIVRLVPGFPPDGFSSLDQLASQHAPLEALLRALEREDSGALLAREGRPVEEPLAVSHWCSWPLIQDDPGCGEFPRTLYDHVRDLEAAAAVTAWPPLHSLLDYWRIDLRDDPVAIDGLVERLNALTVVDLAWAELEATDPGSTALGSSSSVGSEQVYLRNAPEGIGASWAQQWVRPSGNRIRVVDLEQSWLAGHQNLPQDLVEESLKYGTNRALYDHETPHGVAVCGALIAKPGDARLQGIVSSVADVFLASHYHNPLKKDFDPDTPDTIDLTDPRPAMNGNVVDAIVHLVAGDHACLRPCDILLLEVQRCRLPTEIDPADRDAIRLATATGILVVEAAGNGGYDLDRVLDPEGRRSLAKGRPGFVDSGALMVGASTGSLPYDRLGSSNYGRRIDNWAPGRQVVTCGYGDLFQGNGVTEHLTDTFSGTSAASAILAGAAALLQALVKKGSDTGLSPGRLRALLRDPKTGTPQGRGVPGRINVMPDLRAILEKLGCVPRPCIRKNPCDDGLLAPKGDVWSSPDIYFQKVVSTQPAPPAPGPHDPAPGLALVPASPTGTVRRYKLWTRLKNPGLVDANGVQIDLYCAPPATLVTPEMWSLAGSTTATVPAGDSLVQAASIDWGAPVSPRDEAYAWLAVHGHGTPPELPERPPGGTYFDLRAYRRFLASPQVACRNVYRARPRVGSSNPPQVRFWVTGTPDRARRFDFELLQRLPVGGTTRWTVDPSLGLKLYRSLNGVAPGDVVTELELPSQPCTQLRGITLQRGARHEVTIEFPSNFDLDHVVAIRQLYRGVEVGRITFYF